MSKNDAIEIEMSWKATAQALLAVLQDGTETGKQMAKQQILRMAEVADLHVAAQAFVPQIVVEVTYEGETIVTSNAKVEVVVINDAAPSYLDRQTYSDIELPMRVDTDEREVRRVSKDVAATVDRSYAEGVHTIVADAVHAPASPTL